MQTTRRILSDGWRMREVPPNHVPEHNNLPWMPVQVPGHVHLDLMRHGVIADPFARMHERATAWVDDRDWIYETTFAVEDPAPTHAFLKFHGLDTVAEIELNGERLGDTDNMYVPHEFPVGGQLRAGAGDEGRNTLRVTFRSALRVGRARQQAWVDAGETVPNAHWDWFSPRSFVRKAQYMYGWDWGPVLLGCGIWQPVELVTVPIARLGDWKYAVEFTEDGKAIVTITAEVERYAQTPVTLTAALAKVHHVGARWIDTDIAPVCVAVPEEMGTATLETVIIVDAPRLWQPNGAGDAWLYRLDLKLSGEQILDALWADLGLRTIELIREIDDDGEGFKFRVNGQDIFAKGANWIPADSFPARLEHQGVRFDDGTDMRIWNLILAARDADFNMLRVWGGGLYESEHFYRMCDEHGILVWQDFPYACAQYPDTPDYQDAARAEATAAVRRIRNHPSLALWCGNNENDWAYRDWGWASDAEGREVRFLGESLYHEVLPAVVAAEDPQTPYWPSSPFGGADPNSQKQGDCHNWDVWHGRGDWTHYPENDTRFCSEFGFAASCGLAAWDTVLAPQDRHPHSLAVRWHDKTRKGYETYLGYSALHFPEPQTLEDLVYFTQLNQAEALKCGVEHYRRRKGHCWGTLFWQLNDCWPAQTWAIIDSLGEPKAAYFAAKKFYAPLLLSLVRDGETVTAHLVNDFLHAVEGTLTFSLEPLDGSTPLSTESHAVKIGPNRAAPVATFSVSAAQGIERDVYVYARFQPGTSGRRVENFLFLAEPKDLRLSDPGLSFSVEEQETYFYVSLTARCFAPYVWLRRSDNVPLELFDNFFHLRPGETRELSVPKSGILSAEMLRGLLVARTL